MTTYYYKNGKREMSFEYIDGVETGFQIEYDKKGNKVTECNFINGQLSGPKTDYYPNGKVMFQGNFKDGVLHGKTTNHYENGDMSTTIFSVGNPTLRIDRDDTKVTLKEFIKKVI